MSSKFDELVAKLTEIFQIDKPELDFGVYKVINAKAGMIRDFLNNDLKQKVQAALADKAGNEKQQKLDELNAHLRTLAEIEDPNPEANPKTVRLRKEIAALDSADDSESLVYAHLLTFFSRYYDEGDFISKRRYKEGQYVIPYSGEEVKLHWANADQYYTKSGENFTNYDFKLDNGRKVHFKLVAAATAKDNVKDNDCVRCFVAWDPEENEELRIENEELESDDASRPPLPDTLLEEKDGELYIYFQYKKFPKGTKKAELLAATVAAVKAALARNTTLLATYNLLAQVSKDDKRTIFEKQFNRYTAKNTSDYFIHKDLRGFLTREMNGYVTNEMMNLDDISNAATFDAIAPNLRLIQAFRAIATELIGFMAQLEDFQKKLWLKKKFVVQCDWCVTISKLEEEIASLKERKATANAPRIAEIEALITEAKANSAQQAEWKKWGVEADPKATDMMAVDARMIDTKFFDERFKSRLLRALPDLDKQCDGVLVHSENFGALRLMGERYAGKVKSIFIDPPYNTGDDGFPYKDKYQSSSWLSMLDDRLRASYPLLSESGFLGCHMDEHEHRTLEFLISAVFGDGNLGPLIWDKRNPKGDVAGLAAQHEYVHFAAKSKKWLIGRENAFVRDKENAGTMLRKAISLIKRAKGVTNAVREEFALWLDAQDFSGGEKAYKYIDENGDLYQSVSMAAPDKPETRCHTPLIHPITGKPCPVPAKGWRNKWESMLELLHTGQIIFGEDESTQPRRKYLLNENMTEMLPSLFYFGGSDDTLFSGMALSFSNPKTVRGGKYFLKAMARPSDSLILDYFGGSGTTAHAVISLNREDGGHRKYILVEMGDHFDTVLKPRIEKVVYSPEWKDGKPVTSTRGISHCFKYLTLESYEDTLNNLKLETPQGAELGVGKNEYMMNYMLDIESRASLLSVDKLRHPFDYSLDIAVDSSGATAPRKIDLVETFNYLVGLAVESEDRHIDKGYVLVTGTLPGGEDAIILWRDCEKVDNAKLRDILRRQAINPREKGFVLYVNGDHDLPNTVTGEDGGEKTIKVASIDAAFLERMFAED